ncbi:hypothetical protein OQ496_11090 [Acetobacter suratthaniensis]|uniref:Uncharacterized protein n=1 Tax=Acetobacter suratthaniensis TaxID=1502841 RepID=A0ABS3LND0_9PROT|nr:hypothetical protein [Acetobacter suratthaniensis]MBO1328850.1 hypothetical protein [Acetobacter suratthaniensis]MCX2566999.1 hypothetical protein [Acetobacter suratthaniensis]
MSSSSVLLSFTPPAPPAFRRHRTADRPPTPAEVQAGLRGFLIVLYRGIGTLPPGSLPL